MFPYVRDVFKVCENETRYVLQRKNVLNNASKELRNESKKSQMLGNEAQALRNKSQMLGNEAQALRNKS